MTNVKGLRRRKCPDEFATNETFHVRRDRLRFPQNTNDAKKTEDVSLGNIIAPMLQHSKMRMQLGPTSPALTIEWSSESFCSKRGHSFSQKAPETPQIQSPQLYPRESKQT